MLAITIDIGDGRKDEILVRENDDPRVLAEQFCKKHKLSLEVREMLISEIQQNLDFQEDNSVPNKSDESKVSHSESMNSSIGFSAASPISPKPYCASPEKSPAAKEVLSSKESGSLALSTASNYGEKLYLKGKRFIETVNKKKLQILKQKEDKEMQENTFKPKINPQGGDRQQTPQHLINKGQQRQKSIEKKREEQLAEELRACTFSPLLCKNSERIAKNLQPDSPDRFTKLYNNAKLTQNKLKVINDKYTRQQCPFTPETNTVKRPPNLSTDKREKISQSRKAIEAYLSSKNITKDPQTGQDFFKPVTGRPPRARRDLAQKPVAERLYSQRSKSQDSKKSSTQPSNKLSSQQSEKILNRIKELRFKKIFEELRPDEFERISAEGIKRSTLSPRTSKILSPLLQEMQELNERLNLAEFQESMEILMKSLRPDERSIVLKVNKEKCSVQEPEFKPKLNRSAVRVGTVESLYERSLNKLRRDREKAEQGKKDKEDNEMSECTFKPKILKHATDQSQSLNNSSFDPFLPLSGSHFF